MGNTEQLLFMDEYGTTFNCPEAYEWLSKALTKHKTAIVAWTDQEGTQYDLWLSYYVPYFFGPVQGGLRATDLFVSVMRRGAFGFDITGESDPGYYAEKLNLDNSSTTKKLAEFLNGLRKALTQIRDL